MNQPRFKAQVLQDWLRDFRFVLWVVVDSYLLEACHQDEKEETSCLVTLSAPACAMSICKAAATPLEAPLTTFEPTLSIIPQHI